MPTLNGTWLYIGNYPVIGGTGSSPVGGTAAMSSLEGVTAAYNAGLSFTEVNWQTDSSNTAYPLHNSTSTVHSATYDLGNGSVTSQFATFAHYEVKLTFQLPDGSIYTTTETFTLRQTVNGDTFVTPSDDFGDPYVTFPYPLLSVTLVDCVSSNWDFKMVGVRDFTPGGEVSPPIETCFVNGTRIMTRQGERLVEDIRPGDEVWTADNGYQIVRWVGRREMNPTLLKLFPNLRPVRIAAGALGEGCPETDLLVSRQHRILLRSAIAERMFGAFEVLVAAKDLLGWPGVEIDEVTKGFSYHHLLFDQHEILMSNGLYAESLYLGAQTERALSPAARQEILTLLPELQALPGEVDPVRHMAKGRGARQLLSRHGRNGKPLMEVPA